MTRSYFSAPSEAQFGVPSAPAVGALADRGRDRSPDELAAYAADALARVRADAPLVQAIINRVVSGFTANVLLALGASPAMSDIPGEAGPFAREAGALLVNLGTPGAEQREAMREAAAAANAAGTPWVLDPVAIGSAPVRTPLAHELRDLVPGVVRGNPSEILALAGMGSGGRGVDATDRVDAASRAAADLAGAGSVVAVSGEVDLLTDGRDVVRCANGDALLTRVTGGGCALGAVIAAFASLGDDRLAAASAAHTVYGIAAERAAAHSRGPGSFAVALLDELAAVEPADVRQHARLSVVAAPTEEPAQ